MHVLFNRDFMITLYQDLIVSIHNYFIKLNKQQRKYLNVNIKGIFSLNSLKLTMLLIILIIYIFSEITTDKKFLHSDYFANI